MDNIVEFIRLFHIDDYDVELGRFQSCCFARSSNDGGVSIFRVDCAETTSGSICAHALAKYTNVDGEFPVIWRFDGSALPSCARIEQKTENDDVCHYNIYDLSDGQCRRVVKDRVIGDFSICNDLSLQPV